MPRLDPLFGVPTPLLFAHRGGVREVPESTERAFRHAVDVAHADVLELDVQVTRDEQLVVWHGPSLRNVRIRGADDRPGRRPRARDDIGVWKWEELAGRAWVAGPEADPEDLSGVEEAPDTRLLLLEEFLGLFPDAALNIEMKRDTFRPEDVRRFIGLLDAHRGTRTILVASQSRRLLAQFRDETRGRYPTSLAVKEALSIVARGTLRRLRGDAMKGLALQTTYAAHLTPARLVRAVQQAGGTVHVFMNRLGRLVRGFDERPGRPTREEVFALLDRGVDGVMTDRPALVRAHLDAWIAARTGA